MIELLVVLLIIALIAGVVVLNMPPPDSNTKDEADIFAARLNAAAEQAVMTGALIGLEMTEGGYTFYRYDRGVWSETGDRRLASHAFPADVAVEFTLTDPAKKNERTDDKPRDKKSPAPTVFFAPTGETTAFEADFKSLRGNASVTLDAAGDVKAARNE